MSTAANQIEHYEAPLSLGFGAATIGGTEAGAIGVSLYTKWRLRVTATYMFTNDQHGAALGASMPLDLW